MNRTRWGLLLTVLVAGLGLAGLLTALPRAAAQTPPDLIVLGWNDLGMHCINRDFADLAVLPPFNNLWAQVVQPGDPPQVITQGVTLSYSFANNTESASKTNFWQHAQKLFGLSAPLPLNVGLTGKGLAGEMDRQGIYFVAEGIPITEYSDSAPTVPDPYQLATLILRQEGTNKELARTQVVVPVSSEMRCDLCHSDGGEASRDIAPTGKVETNILALHDAKHQDEYPSGHTGALMGRRPVLCAECHGSNALGAAGVAGLPSLSNAMHKKHAGVDNLPNTLEGCYMCHPGPQTRCLRDVMSTEEGMDCIDCHGNIEQVGKNRTPWLSEPRCDDCHDEVQQNAPLYRHSTGHSNLYCAACHDSPHAIAPSREPRDGLKFQALQGNRGGLYTCSVCHTVPPQADFAHNLGDLPTPNATATGQPTATTRPPNPTPRPDLDRRLWLPLSGNQ